VPGQEVLYLGDLNKPGLDIERNAQRALSDSTGWEVASRWTRLATTPEQAKGRKPKLKVDGRGKHRREERSWDAESLGQAQLVAIVRDALDARLPEPLDRVRERENAEREAEEAVLRGSR
jgi:hypothetical protein